MAVREDEGDYVKKRVGGKVYGGILAAANPCFRAEPRRVVVGSTIVGRSVNHGRKVKEQGVKGRGENEI